ncbi:MAG: peptidoglycan DD-metalloendopeptidase family protein [Propionibacteriaceae bacterium]|nr:peptidoglycan DD-metalloendopeptidase family protein [Propionibacteriaceae bacterium]
MMITTAVTVIVNVPSMIIDNAVNQVKDYITSAWTWITGGDQDTVADYAAQDYVPWGALFAIEEDTARNYQTYTTNGGAYGIDQNLYQTGPLSGEPKCANKNTANLDLGEDETVFTNHKTATSIMACQLQTALSQITRDITPLDVMTGVTTYRKPGGGTAYRVDEDDPGATRVREIYTEAFGLLPIPEATQRAPGLYDLMMRAMLGIMDSCGDTTTTTGMTMTGEWVKPVAAPVNDEYGMRVNPVDGGYRLHAGLDFAASCGTPIMAAASGTVTFAAASGGFGGLVKIDHGGGVSTWYAHQDPGNLQVQVGQTVDAGEQIGLVNTFGNSTGCHLHLEVHQDGAMDQAGGNTIGPRYFLETRGVNLDTGETTPTGDGMFQATDSKGDVWKLTEPAQTLNAQTIVQTGRDLGASDLVIQAALGTGLVESHLKNLASEAVPESLNYPNDGVADGDADSVGVFQQRTSQGWGTVEQIMTSVAYQATQFYDRAIPMADADASLTAGQISVAVQRPDSTVEYKYTRIEPVAVALLQALGGTLTASTPQCSTTSAGVYSADAAGIVQAATEMGAWGGWYLWGGGHGTLEDLQTRIDRQFKGGRLMPLDETPAGDTDMGSTQNEFGVDCSGFVRAVIWQATGVDVGMWSYEPDDHPDIGVYFTKVTEETAQPGDIFFTGTHTGIVLLNDHTTRTYQVMSARSVILGIAESQEDYGTATRGVYRWIGAPSGDEQEG